MFDFWELNWKSLWGWRQNFSEFKTHSQACFLSVCRKSTASGACCALPWTCLIVRVVFPTPESREGAHWKKLVSYVCTPTETLRHIHFLFQFYILFCVIIMMVWNGLALDFSILAWKIKKRFSLQFHSRFDCVSFSHYLLRTIYQSLLTFLFWWFYLNSA